MPKPTQQELSLYERASQVLQGEWERVVQLCEEGAELPSFVSEELATKVEQTTNCPMLSYRYVLLTQLLAKIADPSLNATIFQLGDGAPGRFNARTFCQHVVVPFDQANYRVLGGSTDPYVSNPLRYADIEEQHRSRSGDEKHRLVLRELVLMAEYALTPEKRLSLLRQILVSIVKRLKEHHVTYSVPLRASIEQTSAVIADFMAQPSRGLRPQAVAAALLQTCGEHLGLWATIVTKAPTVADGPSGTVADVDCLSDDGTVVLAAEVKDRQLTLADVTAKVPELREKGIAEFLYLLGQGAESGIDEVTRSEFARGHNIYVVDLLDFAHHVLIILGEDGRRTFLSLVGSTLDNYRAGISHRRAWANLLQGI